MINGIRCATTPQSQEERLQLQERTRLWIERLGPVNRQTITTIPVAFHIITHANGVTGDVTDQQIMAQVDTFNSAFANSNFQFSLLSIDRTANTNWYNDNNEVGYKTALAVDLTTTLNIYTNNPPNNILGYSYLASDLAEDDIRHGVVVLYSTLPGGTAAPFDEGDTGTHEVGHYLGLLHTFDPEPNGCDPPGDIVDDTPDEATPATGCPIGRNTCPSAGVDPIHNFMDYVDDACMYEFTPGQSQRMDEQVAIFKPALLQDDGFTPQGSPNVTLHDNVNDYPSVGYNDCWGYTAPDGREYALLGVQNGTSIIDITDSGNAAEVAFISSPASIWKDIKTFQNFAYVVNETNGGMQIIDLTNLPNSAALVGTYTGFSTSHNIYIDEPSAILYAEGSVSEPVRTISLADPLNPVQISQFGIECHDIYARDNIVYVSEGTLGSIGIFDLTIPAAPAFADRVQISNAGYVHNAWLNDDGNFLMTTEETQGKTVKLFDIQDLGNASITDEYLGPGNLAHNAHIKGNFAYISHYADGLRIVDITNPNNIFEAGFFDTSSSESGFNGAWGAFPFFPSGKILISDIQSGLYVISFDPGIPPSPLVFRVARSTGDVFADGSFIPSGADIAERINVSEPVEAGDVVELDPIVPGYYRKARGNSQLIAGVIATKPGFILGNNPVEMDAVSGSVEVKTSKSKIANRPMLVLMGRVPVKATTENGLINAGDLLTVSSKPGYAMRCVKAKECEGAIIGKALQGLEREAGLILVMVMVR